jgi:hypothetical protein
MKKKLFLIFACLAFFAGAGSAQDIITKQDGDIIRANISEVSIESVRYKKFEIPDGPDYVLAASEVFMIKYKSGSKDMFEKDPATGRIKIRHIEAVTQTPTAKPAITPEQTPASQPTSTPASQPASTSVPQPAAIFPSGVRIRQSSNGTFALLGFEGASLRFRAAVRTPVYMVSLTSGRQTVRAKVISSTKGDIVFDNGASAKAGSSLLLGSSGMYLQKGTEVRCSFDNAPAGFMAKTVVFLTGEKASPVSYDIVKGEWITPPQPENPVQASPDVPQSSSRNIVDLLENNIIEAQITGKDITQVNLRLRRLVSSAVEVQIPAGCFFVAENSGSQNMAATVEKTVRLSTNSWTTVSIPVASLNRTKNIPGINDRFTVQRPPAGQGELAQLFSAFAGSDAGALVKQSAVWIVTDDAGFDELGILTNSEKTRIIWYETTVRAMKICADAGIDITKKRILYDRETIAAKLAEGELKDWINSLENAPAQLQSTAEDELTGKASDETITTIKFSGGSCRFGSVDLNPRFAPARMSREKEKPFMLVLEYILEDGVGKEALNVLYDSGQFVAPDGNSYSPGAALRKDGTYILVVAVPKDIDISTLKYVFEGQILLLNKPGSH